MDVRIREQRLPGLGHRYELLLESGRRLVVVLQRDGRREIGLAALEGDEPNAVASLSSDQAVAVAAILTGARFSIDTSEDDQIAAGKVAVETITLGEHSPAVGRLLRDVPLATDSEATILAIIREETPELVEDEATQPCLAGDRVVVAARRERLADVVRQLLG